MKRLSAFMFAMGIGLVSIAAAKTVGSTSVAWLIGFLAGVAACELDYRFFHRDDA